MLVTGVVATSFVVVNSAGTAWGRFMVAVMPAVMPAVIKQRLSRASKLG
jgi:hypothetical protein